MALNLTTIRHTNPTTLTITKKTCINFNTRLPILISRHPGPFNSYPINPDPSSHLNPGNQVQLLAILTAQQAGYANPHLHLKTQSGIEFYCDSSDISRFLSL
jgi:hypothetical protein